MSRDGHRKRGIEPKLAGKIHQALIEQGFGLAKASGGATWRLQVGDTDLGYWAPSSRSTGTLYGTPSRSDSPEVTQAWVLISSMTPPSYVAPSRSTHRAR